MMRCETVVLIMVYVKQLSREQSTIVLNQMHCSVYLYLNTLPIYINIFKGIYFFLYCLINCYLNNQYIFSCFAYSSICIYFVFLVSTCFFFFFSTNQYKEGALIFMLFFTSEILHNFLIFIAIGMVVKLFLRGIFRKIVVH